MQGVLTLGQGMKQPEAEAARRTSPCGSDRARGRPPESRRGDHLVMTLEPEEISHRAVQDPEASG